MGTRANSVSMQHSRDVPFRLLTSGHNQEMLPSSAAAVEFAGPRQVRVAAVALPEPGPDEVVVTTHFSGISGFAEQCLKSVDRLGMGRTFPGDRLKVPS